MTEPTTPAISTDSSIAVIDPPLAKVEPPGRVKRRWNWRGFIPAVVLVAFLIGNTFPGLAYRQWVWEFTSPGRFRGDINRNYTFGLSAIKNGFLNLYENDIRDDRSFGEKLDYPPMRLFTFEMWAKWNQRAYPTAKHWRPLYEFSAPLLNYYNTLEWLGSFAAMMTVLTWLRQCRKAEVKRAVAEDAATGRLAGRHSPSPGIPGEGKSENVLPYAVPSTLTRRLSDPFSISPWTGVIRAMIAFALLWFDPGVQFISHGWPSPNMWAIPFYLWAVLLSLWDCWFIAGCVMGVGAMLQGQLMFVSPLFVLWPLFAGRPTRALRAAAGFALAFMLCASGWMVTYRPNIQSPDRFVDTTALVWIIASATLLSLVGMRSTLQHRLNWKWFAGVAAVAFIVLIMPSLHLFAPGAPPSPHPTEIDQSPVRPPRDAALIGWTLIGASVVLGLFWRFRWRTKRYFLALTVAGCLLLCIPYFGASTAWWDVGFRYGAERFTNVGGKLVNNLPALLDEYGGWHDIKDTAFTIPAKWLLHMPAEPYEVDIRQVLFSAYMVMFTAGAIALATQWRRKDRNFLIAAVLPWVLFFTILPQMSPRYAVFTAGVGAICIGRAMGMTACVWFFSALTIVQTGLCMMWGNHISDSTNHPLFNENMRRLFESINPGVSWAEMTVAGVFIWLALTSSREKGTGLAGQGGGLSGFEISALD